MTKNLKVHMAGALIVGILIGFAVGRAAFVNDIEGIIQTLSETNGTLFMDEAAKQKMEREQKRIAEAKKAREEKYKGLKIFNGTVEKAPSIGDDNAPITIEEYSDYQCPYCSAFYMRTMPSLLSQYIKTGKVRLEFKDFPLSFHKAAGSASIAAKCAGDQEAYWYMHDILFTNQTQWSDKNEYDAREVFIEFAKELGLETNEFEQCMTSNKYEKSIDASFKEGAEKGVNGTPGFLVNGETISGAQPFAVFDKVIKEQLEKIGKEESE